VAALCPKQTGLREQHQTEGDGMLGQAEATMMYDKPLFASYLKGEGEDRGLALRKGGVRTRNETTK